MGSTFSPHPDIRLLRDRLTVQSKKLLLKNLEDICLESIQTCILVANLCAANASPSSEALFFRIAVSMAQILRLTSLQPGDTLVVHEVKRRIWWSLFMADCWYSSGLNLPRQIQDRERPAALPMDESIFHSLAIGKESLGGPHKLGLWAHMITLVDLFGPIQDLNRRIVQEDLEDNEIDRCAYDISQRIEDWEKTLPLDAKFNEENLREHKRRGTGGPFIALHLGFHHYSTLLYFQYLDVKRATTVDTKLYAERCKHHASSYSALLKVARSEEGLAAVYLTVGHMAVISSSVLLHTLLFDDEHRIRSARDSLNANFEALIELEQYWPALKSIINRLIEFQNMCLLSATSHTHVLSKWMLRFLIEYALPIERDTTIVDTSVTGPELQVVSIDTQRLEEQGRFTTFPTYEAKS
ncbi:hypothetical protein OIDMADRAFT_126100 [Oidiodendron maius Zn]|uniref:Xylanolytic transcriptional activator regulatory domain-containing protein n=1 Tax=Oidiodendron maius (strain Zn) TaxID=913774 RepID=A0A0C3HBK1_OIDMZ|nr:hypothetical protein OIDMADRAFT_126100 [Oidiodendron maius Zn]